MHFRNTSGGKQYIIISMRDKNSHRHMPKYEKGQNKIRLLQIKLVDY